MAVVLLRPAITAGFIFLATPLMAGLAGCEKPPSAASDQASKAKRLSTVDTTLPANLLKPQGMNDLSTAARLVIIRGIQIKMDESFSRFLPGPRKRTADAFEAASTLGEVDAWKDLKGLPNERFTNIRAIATPLGRFVISDVTWPNASDQAIVVMCVDEPCASVGTIKGNDLNPSGAPASNAVVIAEGMKVYAKRLEDAAGRPDTILQSTLRLIDGMKPQKTQEPTPAQESDVPPGRSGRWFAANVSHSSCHASMSPADKVREIQDFGKYAKVNDLPRGVVEVEQEIGGGRAEVWTFYPSKMACESALPRSQAINPKYE